MTTNRKDTPMALPREHLEKQIAGVATTRTTSITAAWEQIADESSRSNAYFGTFRPDKTVHLCQRCGGGFRSPTRQRHCSVACRDADRNDEQP
jgi:hypothetical protein